MPPLMPLAMNAAGVSNRNRATITLFLTGDVMTGRGVDQILPHPGDPQIYESYMKSANDYVTLAERTNGPISRPQSFAYVWGDALAELDRRKPDVRIINLETAVTQSLSPEPKGINYKMSPSNIGVITAAGIDCCVLANNHALDWGRAGLTEGLVTLEQAGVRYAGAGRDDAAAAVPAILPIPGNGRVVVFAIATPDSGVPLRWAAAPGTPGVNVVYDLSRETAGRMGAAIRAVLEAGDVVVASIHWGGNWGYEISDEQVAFAHRLVDECDVDIVHGHSSHHVKGIEVYRGKLILYGCGDFIDDYEGISGYEQFRDDLVLMYFPEVRIDDGSLVSLEMVPFEIRNMRLNRAARADAEWLAGILSRDGKALGTAVRPGPDGVLSLKWPP